MWSRLDDALIDHRKVFQAAEIIGPNGGVIAIGLYAMGLMYANKHLTDGFVPLSVVRSWTHVADGPAVADALVRASLWTKTGRHGTPGFLIHDFGNYNPSATTIRSQRKRDADRKAAERKEQKRQQIRRKNGHA